MFECTICGLLSLNAISCPACGSQNLTDLSNFDDSDEQLPTEIPGLDEAADSWHEFEGSEQVKELENTNHISKDVTVGSLPFSFSGQSNITLSRLPFGIGSHSEGMPFEQKSNNVESNSEDKSVNVPQLDTFDDVQSNSNLVTERVLIDETSPKSDEKVEDLIPELIVKKSNPVRLQAITDDSESINDGYDVLSQEFSEPDNPPKIGIPDEWKISASEANMEEIYSKQDQVVEVVHQFEDDVVIFQHEPNEVKNVQTGLSSEISSKLSLELHPARAMDVDLSKNPECRDDLDAGYFAIAEGSWSEAAIRFQHIAARMPGHCAVFNNYGLALLQRAIEMSKSLDESIQMLATSQFESSILALRESAKINPEESLVLLNLAHALLVSGRSEKALKIIQVHNSDNPLSIEGANLEAAALVSLGQSVNAKAKLAEFQGDVIIDENLARLL